MTRLFILKAWLGGAGLAVGLFGMATEHRWMIWAAVSLLSAAFTVRMIERRAE